MARRCAVAIVALITLAACNDVRDFRGAWTGVRVGDTAAVRVGTAAETASLAISSVDRLGLQGTLTVPNLCTGAVVAPLAGAEADRLGSLSFDGAPLRVYVTFVATIDGGGDALAMIALYDDDRVEVRLLRGGSQPIYAIFDLAR